MSDFSAEFSRNLRSAGVVGAGGAGFPSYVKAQGRAEYALVNAAECEPLLKKDQKILEYFPAKVFDGLEMLMKAAILHGGGRIREKRAKETIGFDACVRRSLSDGKIKDLKEIKIGKAVFKRYSPKAIEAIKEALERDGADEIWRKQSAKARRATA